MIVHDEKYFLIKLSEISVINRNLNYDVDADDYMILANELGFNNILELEVDIRYYFYGAIEIIMMMIIDP